MIAGFAQIIELDSGKVLYHFPLEGFEAEPEVRHIAKMGRTHLSPKIGGKITIKTAFTAEGWEINDEIKKALEPDKFGLRIHLTDGQKTSDILYHLTHSCGIKLQWEVLSLAWQYSHAVPFEEYPLSLTDAFEPVPKLLASFT